jgi:hypothetical protein
MQVKCISLFNLTRLCHAGCPLRFETGGTMEYNCCFFLNFVPLHIESPYNFWGTGPIVGVKKTSAEGKWACCHVYYINKML